MEYRIEGGNLPVAIIKLQAGEDVVCEGGAMSWMDDGLVMRTEAGGLGKVFGKLITNENIFTNRYVANSDGEIAFASSFPGSIIAVEVTPDRPIIAQKGAFLAYCGNINTSIAFQKKISGGFFGGEGFLMQKFSGTGTLFLEIDGASVEYDLEPGQKKIIDTGHLAMMEGSVTLSVEAVKGIKNVLLGGEGLFNTVLKGPGKVVLQTMPISNMAAILSMYTVSK